MTSFKRVATVSQSFLWSFIARSFFFLFFCFASFVRCLPGFRTTLKNVSLGDDSDQRRAFIIKGTYREVPREIHCSLHIWQVTVNRDSEDSLLIHNFQPWQRSSGNSIKSSTIVLNRYWNIYSFRPQFNQYCMFLHRRFSTHISPHPTLREWKKVSSKERL